MAMLPRLKPAQFLRPGDRGGDRAARAHPGRHGASLSAPPAGAGAGDLSERGGARGAGAHAGRADLPGAGDAARRWWPPGFTPARPTSCAAPWRPGSGAAAWSVSSSGCIDGMRERGYRDEFARQIYQQILRLRRVRLSRVACGELRAAGLRLGLAQAPRPGGLQLRAAQQPADGLLCAGAAGAGCAAPRRRGAAGGRDCTATGTARWSAAEDGAPALRLGLRMVKGLSQAAARAHRRRAWRRRLCRRAAARRARRPESARPARPGRGRWRLRGSPATGASPAGRSRAWNRPCRCFRRSPITEPAPQLPAPTEGEEIVADYASLGFPGPASAGAAAWAPRAPATAHGCGPATLAHGQRVRAAGLVTCRQRPDRPAA